MKNAMLGGFIHWKQWLDTRPVYDVFNYFWKTYDWPWWNEPCSSDDDSFSEDSYQTDFDPTNAHPEDDPDMDFLYGWSDSDAMDSDEDVHY